MREREEEEEEERVRKSKKKSLSNLFVHSLMAFMKLDGCEQKHRRGTKLETL